MIGSPILNSLWLLFLIEISHSASWLKYFFICIRGSNESHVDESRYKVKVICISLFFLKKFDGEEEKFHCAKTPLSMKSILSRIITFSIVWAGKQIIRVVACYFLIEEEKKSKRYRLYLLKFVQNVGPCVVLPCILPFPCNWLWKHF